MSFGSMYPDTSCDKVFLQLLWTVFISYDVASAKFATAMLISSGAVHAILANMLLRQPENADFGVQPIAMTNS
jgi:hypothetical protein